MRTAAQRHLSLARGHVAEVKALAALMLKGYRPLARRYAVQGGEIDIIVARRDTIAFVEPVGDGAQAARRRGVRRAPALAQACRGSVRTGDVRVANGE
jgi:Holliday junction resolvase-like predicted endonuclease